MATITYQKRTEPVYNGQCNVCWSIIKPKTTSEGKQEWFCHMCGGARRFCEDPECFCLLEVFYSKCEEGNHHRVIVPWASETEITEEDWLAASEDDDGGVESSWRLHPNRPQFR